MRTLLRKTVFLATMGIMLSAKGVFYFGTITNSQTGAAAFSTLTPTNGASEVVTSNQVITMIPIVRRATAKGWTYSGMPPNLFVTRGMEFNSQTSVWTIEVTPSAGGVWANPVILETPGSISDLSVSFTYQTYVSTSTIIATAISSGYYIYGDQGTLPIQPAGDYAYNKDIFPLQMASWYPEGDIVETNQWTAGIKYTFDDSSQTATVKPFCNSGTASDDNSNIEGDVVIPAFVMVDDTKYTVVGIESTTAIQGNNDKLTSIIAPTTVIRVGMGAFAGCVNLTSAKLPAAPLLEEQVFYNCSRLQKVSLPRCAAIGNNSFGNCYSLTEVSLPLTTELFANVFQQNTGLQKLSLPNVTNIADSVFSGCTQLAEVNFGGSLAVVPSLGSSSFPSLSGSCRLIVPDALYDAWSTTNGWGSLTSMGYTYMKYSEWEYSREYEVKAAMQPDTYWDYSDMPEGEILYRGMEFDASKGVWSIIVRGNAGGLITEHTLSAFGTAADTKVLLTNMLWAVQATLLPYWKYADRADVKLQPSGNYPTAAETEGMLKDIGMRFVYPTFSQNKYSLVNFSYNYVSNLLDDEPVTFVLPTANPTKGRQLVLVVYCSSVPTGVTMSVQGATTLIYPNGQSADFWTLAAGYNIFRFEEIAAGLFLMSKTVGN